MSITIYGASDDLIEIDGDIRAEFEATNDGDYVALSNGCLFSIDYTSDGVWRVAPIAVPDGITWLHEPAVGVDDDNYSDRMTIVGRVAWVVVAPGQSGYARPLKASAS